MLPYLTIDYGRSVVLLNWNCRHSGLWATSVGQIAIRDLEMQSRHLTGKRHERATLLICPPIRGIWFSQEALGGSCWGGSLELMEGTRR